MRQEYNRNLIYRFLYPFIGFYRFVGTAFITEKALSLDFTLWLNLEIIVRVHAKEEHLKK